MVSHRAGGGMCPNQIIKRGKVCTLTDTGALVGTAISSGTGFVYVVDVLVDEYKTAENWIIVADRIKPLSEWSGDSE